MNVFLILNLAAGSSLWTKIKYNQDILLKYKIILHPFLNDRLFRKKKFVSERCIFCVFYEKNCKIQEN